jgi:hypothetical protein
MSDPKTSSTAKAPPEWGYTWGTEWDAEDFLSSLRDELTERRGDWLRHHDNASRFLLSIRTFLNLLEQDHGTHRRDVGDTPPNLGK